ncbi:hypothetical protein F5890DRAFT_1421892, partial [Lentinula detonsa]
MSIRPRLRKDRKTKVPLPTATAYELRLAEASTTARRQRKDDEPLVLLTNGRALTQNPRLPRLPGQVGLRGDRPVTVNDIARAGREGGPGTAPPMEDYTDSAELLSPSKHRRKRLKQWQTWTGEMIPMIILPYMELLEKTGSLREEANLQLRGSQCHCCKQGRWLAIAVIRFSKIEQVRLWASSCHSAALQLVRSGLFPCSPVYPTLAVDIRVLDFVRRLFLRIAPNYTAWCSAVVDFLSSQGYHLPGDDPL